jgi:hypothetical protein
MTMKKTTFLAAALGSALVFTGPAWADAEERWDARGDRIEDRLDNRGDRIDQHLDRRGDRIDQHLDHRGDRIEQHLR